jgi:glycosyltransferase involved in cell wall biosynthesis
MPESRARRLAVAPYVQPLDSSPLVRLLIIEPEASGHRMSLYVRLLVRACVARRWMVHLLTTKQVTQHAAFALVQDEAGGNLRTSFMENVRASERTCPIALLANQIKYYGAIDRAFKRLPADELPDLVYMMHLDYFDKVLAIRGSPFGAVPFAGMLMDVKHHRRRMGTGPATRSDALYDLLMRRVLRLTALRAVTVIDETFMEFAAAAGHPEYRKVRYVPDVGEVTGNETREESRTALGLPGLARVILVYGTLTRRKGVQQLLEAVAYDGVPSNVAVLLAGSQDAETASLVRGSLAQQLLSTSRLFVSNGFHDDVLEHRVFNAADAVWLGYVEGFHGSSGVLYQAGSMSLPVITAATGLIGWLNKRYGLGVAADPNDKRAMAAAIRALFADDARRTQCAMNGKLLAERHSIDAFQSALCDILAQERAAP